MSSLFNEDQLRVLSSIVDAVFAAHQGKEVQEIVHAVPASDPERRRLAEALARAAFTDLPHSLDELSNQFAKSLSPTNLDALKLGLTLLATRPGTLLLAGHAGPFPDLTVQQREASLLSWSTSRVPLRRRLFRGFAAVSLYVAYSIYDSNVLATGFPLSDATRFDDASRTRQHHPFEFHKLVSDYEYLDTDVLIIGSGAGGGVVASEIAAKGWRTLVLEKGEYLTPEQLTGTAKDGFERLYESGGLMATEDGAINVLAGSTFGGGTVVNWAASLRPQHFLRETWANVHGLPHFLSPNFSQSIDAVCTAMKVSADHLKHNKPNSMLVDASVQLGYAVSNIPQNTGGHQHVCGHCGFGCVYSEKQSGPVCWLRRAAEHGATFATETTVERLLFASSRTSPSPTESTLDNFYPSSSRQICVGALVKTKSGVKAIVRAKEAVVLSAGSIHSPAVLLRSGLKNPRIGKNLRLHPTSYVTGFYDEPINPWEGSIMTAVSTTQENWDGSHHGVKIEVIQSFAGGRAASFEPWRGSKEHKKALVQFGDSFTLICIARDRGSGRIVLDSNGHPRMDYGLDSYDGTSLLRGIVACAEIHLVAGAKRIVTTQTGVEPYEPEKNHQGLSDPKWKEWIARVEKTGVWPGLCGIGSAHQMGSNQMGTKPSSSVVDPRGRVWGTSSLYVADASTFPTASGVNPMITNMAISHSIAQFIDEDLREQAHQTVEARL